MLKTKRAFSRNLGQHSILARKSTFYEKMAFFMKKLLFGKKASLPLYSIPFLNVLCQYKALHNFPKRGQHSIVKCNIGLGYALSTIQKILTSLFKSQFHKPTQNIQHKIKKSSKTAQDKKSLISTFACFLTALAKI